MAEADAEVDLAEGAPAPEEVEAEAAPAPAPEPAVPEGPFSIARLSVAQVSEIFKLTSIEERLKNLGRCLAMDAEEVDEDLRTQIWLDMLLKHLIFCYDNELDETKALAFLGVMTALHAHAVETKCSKTEAYDFYKDAMLGATKALPLDQRFSLAEVQALTGHAVSSYLDAIKLHQLVFTEEQTVRESSAELFLQTPAVPPPMSAAVDPDAAPAPAPDAEPAEPPAEEATEAAEQPPADEAPADEAPPPAENDALTDAISQTITAQVSAHREQLAAEFEAKEAPLLDRISTLEAKAK